MISRVELLFPVVQDNLKARLRHILDVQLTDNVNRYELLPSGEYVKVTEDGDSIGSQMRFYAEACEHAARQESSFAQIIPLTTPQ